VYGLTCHACGHNIEIATREPYTCSICGRVLTIRWR
jgi:predicted RNA-binding Zn-ribbon protein involved in translation (DUF1610 family)